MMMYMRRCVWTGMTRWELNESSGKARQQEDFWDSINLRRGAYRRQLFSGFAAWCPPTPPCVHQISFPSQDIPT